MNSETEEHNINKSEINPDIDPGGPEYKDPDSNGTLTYEEELAEARQQQSEIEEQDRKFLESLDNAIENNAGCIDDSPGQAVPQKILGKIEHSAIVAVNKGVGFVSLGLVLIFLSIVMLVCLFSPEPDFMIPVKLSPVAALLIGIEILFNQISTRGCFKINIPSIVISSVLVIGCCIMCVALNNSSKLSQYEYDDRTMEAEIYDAAYETFKDDINIEYLKVDVDMNPANIEKKKDIKSLGTDDHVKIDVKLEGTFSSPEKFAGECRKVMDGFNRMGIFVSDYHFNNESTFNSYHLDVDGKYEQDYSEERLAKKVDYVYIEEYDYIEDVSEFSESDD